MSATWVVLLVLLLTMLDATVLITSPIVTLFPNNTLPYYYANFGEVPYGKSLRFNLVVPESSLCDNITGMKHLQTPSYVLVLDNFTVNCSQTHLALNA